MYPARCSSRWLATSAPTGSSFWVRTNRDGMRMAIGVSPQLVRTQIEHYRTRAGRGNPERSGPVSRRGRPRGCARIRHHGEENQTGGCGAEVQHRSGPLVRRPALTDTTSPSDTKSMPDQSQLTQFPRPSVAVDTAVLCPVPGRGLHVLLTHPGDGVWQLPGSILRPQERLAEAVARCLREKARLVDRAPVQLHVSDQPDRDDRGWVISVAHLDVLSAGDVGLARTGDDGVPESGTAESGTAESGTAESGDDPAEAGDGFAEAVATDSDHADAP